MYLDIEHCQISCVSNRHMEKVIAQAIFLPQN